MCISEPSPWCSENHWQPQHPFQPCQASASCWESHQCLSSWNGAYVRVQWDINNYQQQADQLADVAVKVNASSAELWVENINIRAHLQQCDPQWNALTTQIQQMAFQVLGQAMFNNMQKQQGQQLAQATNCNHGGYKNSLYLQAPTMSWAWPHFKPPMPPQNNQIFPTQPHLPTKMPQVLQPIHSLEIIWSGFLSSPSHYHSSNPLQCHPLCTAYRVSSKHWSSTCTQPAPGNVFG